MAGGFVQEPAGVGQVPERPGQPVRDDLGAGRGGGEGRAQVVDDRVEVTPPLAVQPGLQFGTGRGGPPQVPPLDLGPLTARVELVRGERSHGLQQPPSAPRAALAHDEALVDESAEHVGDRAAGSTGRHRGDPRQVEPADEDRQTAEQLSFVPRQQVVAPVEHRAQGPVPLDRPAVGGQHPQAVVECGEQPVGAERRAAGGRELDRQRQAVQPAAEFGDEGLIGREAGVSGGGPVEEQPRGVGGQRQRLDRHRPLARYAGPLPAGDQHRHGGTGRQQPLDELGRGVDEVFAVVQDQQ